MAPLGALSQAWVSAEAALPLGWRTSGLWRFGELWVALAEGPEFDDYLAGSGQFADQALRRLSGRLRERRGPCDGVGDRSLSAVAAAGSRPRESSLPCHARGVLASPPASLLVLVLVNAKPIRGLR